MKEKNKNRVPYKCKKTSQNQSLQQKSHQRNKNSHRKITMTHTQTTYINHIALHEGKKGARPAGLSVQKISNRAQTTKTTKMQTNNTNSNI